MRTDHSKIIIIGGGAAGLYLGALLAANGQGRDTAVVESGPRLGRKLSATGNGQGNVSNADMRAAHYFGGAHTALIGEIIREDTLELFDGLFTQGERGRIYPAGRQASALTDDLRRKLDAGSVRVMNDTRVTGIAHDGKSFEVSLSGGGVLTADIAVLACGGKAQKQFGTDGASYALAEKFGHTVTPLMPSLVQLKTDMTDIKMLKGLRTDCRITAKKDGRRLAAADGEIIFADYGVTGSAIFNISPFITGRDNIVLEIEFVPGITAEQLTRDIATKKNAGYPGEELLALTLHKQLSKAVVRAANSPDPEKIAAKAKRFPLAVTGTLGFDYAQVTRGGIDMNEVTGQLESRLRPGLFFAGEVLDVDGECGGYNLHWAFASAKRVFTAIRNK